MGLVPSPNPPDSVGQVVPAQVDGAGVVLDGVVERLGSGAGQVSTGQTSVAVNNLTNKSMFRRCQPHKTIPMVINRLQLVSPQPGWQIGFGKTHFHLTKAS